MSQDNTTPLQEINPLYIVVYNQKTIGFFFDQDKAKEFRDQNPGSTISETDYQTFLKYNV